MRCAREALLFSAIAAVLMLGEFSRSRPRQVCRMACRRTGHRATKECSLLQGTRLELLHIYTAAHVERAPCVDPGGGYVWRDIDITAGTCTRFAASILPWLQKTDPCELCASSVRANPPVEGLQFAPSRDSRKFRHLVHAATARILGIVTGYGIYQAF